MLCLTFNHNGKCEWSTDTSYNMYEYWKHSKRKKPCRKSHPDHTHLVCFKSVKAVKMRGSLKIASRKRKLGQNGKRHFHALGQVMEVGQWIGLEGKNRNDFSYGGYRGVPWESVPFWGETQWKQSFKLAYVVKQWWLGNLNLQIKSTLYCYCKFSVCLKLVESK